MDIFELIQAYLSNFSGFVSIMIICLFLFIDKGPADKIEFEHILGALFVCMLGAYFFRTAWVVFAFFAIVQSIALLAKWDRWRKGLN